eukprot:jgi/Mesvir1/7904/Mv11835-RA.1
MDKPKDSSFQVAAGFLRRSAEFRQVLGIRPFHNTLVKGRADAPTDIGVGSKMSDMVPLLSEERKIAFSFSVDARSTSVKSIVNMVQKGIGHALVKEDDQVVGIVTERDYLTKIVANPANGPSTPVRDIMTPIGRIVSVEADTAVEDCMAIMRKKNIRHMPIVKDGKLWGVLSIRDVVNHLASAREAEIKACTVGYGVAASREGFWEGPLMT